MSYDQWKTASPFDDYDTSPDINKIIKALSGWDSGRWNWEKIDCCITGKNADIEPTGQQGIQVISATEESVACILHCGLTIAGIEVCLFDDSEDNADARIDKYLEVAQECVFNFPYFGYWDGDSWYLENAEKFTVDAVFDDDADDYDYDSIASNIITQYEKTVEAWDKEALFLSECGNTAAGYPRETT